MLKRTASQWIILVFLLNTVIALAAGGAMGGVAGYAVAVSTTGRGYLPVASQEASAGSNAAIPISHPAVADDSAVIDVVRKTEPAVVTVLATAAQSRGRYGPRMSVTEGSGVIMDAVGHIVTNAHVVSGAQQIQVTLSDGTTLDARLVGADASRDIALLQVGGRMPAIAPLGDSATLQVGESVIAIGSPLGSYRGSVTVGVVSGLERSVPNSGMGGLIQTDAAINSGSSGGPLLNLSGQVVGINTLVVRETNDGNIAEGLGFAIPSSTVATVVKQLIK